MRARLNARDPRAYSSGWLGPALAVVAIVLVGCGGGDERSEPFEESTVVATLGDSITAGAPLWDPDAEVRATLGRAADPESQYQYWAERRLTNVRYRNCGVPGQRTDEIAVRLEDCAAGADVVIVQGGTNDVLQGTPVSAIARNLRGMVRRARAIGLRVAVAEVLPVNDGYPRHARRLRALNRLIARLGRRERVPVYGFYDALEDPRRPGRMRARFTDDGLHPSVEGHRRLAEVIELPSR